MYSVDASERNSGVSGASMQGACPAHALEGPGGAPGGLQDVGVEADRLR